MPNRSDMRGLRFLLAGVVVAAVLPAPANAANATRLTLRGTRGGYVDLTLEKPTKLDFGNPFESSGIELSSEGDYVGFAVQRLPSLELVAALIHVPGMDLSDGRLDARFGVVARKPLKPGRYRFTLIAPSKTYFNQPAHSMASIPVSGLPRSVDVDRLRPTRTEGRFMPLELMPAQPVAVVETPVDIKDTTTTFLAAQIETNYAVAQAASMCVAHERVCERDPSEIDVFVTPGSAYAGMTTARVYRSGSLGAGPWTAYYKLAAAGIPESLSAFVLLLN